MSERINIGFSDVTLASIKAAAQRRGLSVASLVRSIVLEWLADKGEV